MKEISRQDLQKFIYQRPNRIMGNLFILHMKILALLYLFGFGFVLVFIPKNLWSIALWFAPIYSTILIAVLGNAASFGRLPMSQGIYVINLIVLFFILYALITKKPLFIFSLNTLIILLFLFFSPFLLPLSWDNSALLTSSDFLIKHTILDTFAFNRTFADNNYFMGISSTIAYFALLLKQNVSSIALILPNVYLSVFFPLLLVLARRFGIIIKLTLFGLFYLSLRFFPPSFSQFLSVLIWVSMVILVREYFLRIRSGAIVTRFNQFDLLNALLFFSFTLIYPPGFKLTAMIFIFLVMISLFLKKYRWSIILSILKIIILTLIINPIAVRLVFL